MANITLTFNTTTKQDAKLAKVLATVNAERAAQQLPAFATVADYFDFIIKEVVKSYVKQQDKVDADSVGVAFDAADATVQNQVKTLLGL